MIKLIHLNIYYFVIIGALVVGGSLFSYRVIASEGDLSHVGVVGRYDQSRHNNISFSWPGTQLAFRFNGTSLRVRLKDTGHNAFVVEVDGEPTKTLQLKKGTHYYTLASGLAPDEHVVRLTRRTEGFLGKTSLTDAHSDGVFLPAPQRSISMLVIGDSISAGHSVDSDETRCRFDAEKQNQFLTYAAITARHFNADLTAIASSGKGLVQNFDGTTRDIIPNLYGLTHPYIGAMRWDDRNDDWDIIVVHLGTNDFNSNVDPAIFEKRYRDFVRALAKRHAEARIYLGIGPMLAPRPLEQAKKSIESVAKDTNVSAVFFENTNELSEKGCGFHPNLKGHEKMADTLIEVISGSFE